MTQVVGVVIVCSCDQLRGVSALNSPPITPITLAEVNASQTMTLPSCDELTRWRLSLDQQQESTFPVCPFRCRRGLMFSCCTSASSWWAWATVGRIGKRIGINKRGNEHKSAFVLTWNIIEFLPFLLQPQLEPLQFLSERLDGLLAGHHTTTTATAAAGNRRGGAGGIGGGPLQGIVVSTQVLTTLTSCTRTASSRGGRQ